MTILEQQFSVGIAVLPSMIAACHIADNSVLEIAHPDFPELWTHPVVAAFTCSTLKEHRASSASCDWSQVYILMKRRIGQDLSDSVDRIYNAYELKRVQEYQQRYVPNPAYFDRSTYLQDDILLTAAQPFALFLEQEVAKLTTDLPSTLKQLCLTISNVVNTHDLVGTMIDRVSVIKKDGKMIGIRLDMQTSQPKRTHVDFQSQYAFARNCATLVAADILREGLVRPSSTHFPDWLYTAGFYCRGAICNDFSDQGFARALDDALSIKGLKILLSSRSLSSSVYLWQSW